MGKGTKNKSLRDKGFESQGGCDHVNTHQFGGFLSKCCMSFLLSSDKRFALKERRETSAIAYVQHGTVTAPRYHKIGERYSTVENAFHL
jgi:hypothetical protein